MDVPASPGQPPHRWRFAAVDIGSNAVRLLVSDVLLKGKRVLIKENTRVRVPLRLGREAFETGELSAGSCRDLVKTLGAFATLTQLMGVDATLACATAALREAGNGSAIVKDIRAACGMDVRIISGTEEADFIFSTYMTELPFRRGAFLFFDIGGGSTEVAFYQGGSLQGAQSFPLGTVRMLSQGVPASLWAELRFWLQEQAGRIRSGKWIGVGSGGNVKELARLAAKKPVSLKRVESLREQLGGTPLEQRAEKFGLTRERAEVIVPAAEILAYILGCAGVDKLHVPNIGLLEGIVSRLFWERQRPEALKQRGHLEYRWT